MGLCVGVEEVFESSGRGIELRGIRRGDCSRFRGR